MSSALIHWLGKSVCALIAQSDNCGTEAADGTRAGHWPGAAGAAGAAATAAVAASAALQSEAVHFNVKR